MAAAAVYSQYIRAVYSAQRIGSQAIDFADAGVIGVPNRIRTGVAAVKAGVLAP